MRILQGYAPVYFITPTILMKNIKIRKLDTFVVTIMIVPLSPIFQTMPLLLPVRLQNCEVACATLLILAMM